MKRRTAETLTHSYTHTHIHSNKCQLHHDSTKGMYEIHTNTQTKICMDFCTHKQIRTFMYTQ